VGEPVRILLQTTIARTEDDWHVGRFSLLRSWLEAQVDAGGSPLFDVSVRDHSSEAIDPVLATLGESAFDELWLFGVDDGAGLAAADRNGIARFQRRGGGLLLTRDHQDVGSSVCELGCVGGAHYFHTRQPDPDVTRQVRDDRANAAISWPNYHSGRNGDFQRITATQPVHELLRYQASPSGLVEFFPAHPHEGAVDVPPGEPGARVIAISRSLTSGRTFNLAVAFERVGDEPRGRAVAESSFHHFADYNWDPAMGCPSFVTEAPGDEVRRNPGRLGGIKAYVRNLALWLAPPPGVSRGHRATRLVDVPTH
jgi:hypothetical protein